MTPAPLLEVRDLAVTFGYPPSVSTVVSSLSFNINKGETVALVGESGSGKSVTALSLLKLLPYPYASHPSGEVLFQGSDLIKLSDKQLQAVRGRKISIIFQEPMTSLNPLHTVEQQIKEVLVQHEPFLKPKDIQARILSLLENVGIGEALGRLKDFPHQLSGGQRQRVMIAMALACKPALLIADEPTTALDVTTQAQILTLLKSLQETYGMALLLITHDMGVVRHMADRIIVMHQGRSVEKGEAQSLLKAPQHSYTKALMAAEPQGSPVVVPASAPEVLRCENLCVTYPVKKGFFKRIVHEVTALNNISLSLKKGETVGIVGESGSGKSTLALAVLQLIAHKGNSFLKGKLLNNLKGSALREQRRHMQIVFQDPYGSLSPRLTVAAIVGEGLRIHKPLLSSLQVETEVCKILETVGLEGETRHRYPHEFSGGQRQRIAIARALILKPTLIVLDEPTSALDRTIQLGIIELLRTLQAQYGLAYLFISHDLRVIKAMSHRVIVLHQGKMVEEGEAETVFHHPSHPYTQTLLKAAVLDV